MSLPTKLCTVLLLVASILPRASAVAQRELKPSRYPVRANPDGTFNCPRGSCNPTELCCT